MKKQLIIPLLLFVAFVIWTLLVCCVDVQSVGPENSSVGFSSLNKSVHELIGTNTDLYNLTDLLSVIPLLCCVGFALLGLVQIIKRKGITKIDRDIIALGCFYVAVISAYLLFDLFPINYRPILIDGILEPSDPSSTTLLTLSVMPTTLMQIFSRTKNKTLRLVFSVIISLFSSFMVIGRILSGVHWITDVIGGLLLSALLVFGYRVLCFALCKRN